MSSEKQRNGWDHRILLIPGVAVGVGIMVGALLLNQRLVLADCPSGTFIAGIARSDQNRQRVAFVVGVVVISNLIWATLVRLWGTQERSRSNAVGGRFWFKLRIETTNQKMVFIGGPLMLAAMLFFGPIILSHPKFCLTDENIFINVPPSDDLQRYAWNSVVRVDTDCERGARGSWNTSFVATMRDGTDFDLMTAGRQAPVAYPEIASKLRNVNFVFNYHGVEDCGAPLRDVVLHRPR